MPQRDPLFHGLDILITNDDGISGPGLQVLRHALVNLGARVTLVAPRHGRSGSAASVTLSGALPVEEYAEDGVFEGYSVDGTPVDCVKIAFAQFFREAPRLVISGVNEGSNLGNHCFYSGTVGAGLEAAFRGLPAVAVSRKNFLSTNFDNTRHVLQRLFPRLLPSVLEHRGILFNVNIPDLEPEEIRGVRFAPMDQSPLADIYEEVESEKEGQRMFRTVYVPLGWEVDLSDGETDVSLLNQGFITITPLRPDLTCRGTLAAFNGNGASWW